MTSDDDIVMFMLDVAREQRVKIAELHRDLLSAQNEVIFQRNNRITVEQKLVFANLENNKLRKKAKEVSA